MPNPGIHPAPYSMEVLEAFTGIVKKRADRHGYPIKILDPFAGTGRIHQLSVVGYVGTWGVEIEPEWAAMNTGTQVGDATALPFDPMFFDMVMTSPAYGNRFADKHKAKDASVRRSYTHDLRHLTGDPERHLAPNNTGGYLFHQKPYQDLHRKAWNEVWRVLRRRGWFVLNVSDSIRNGDVVPVCNWHHDVLTDLGFKTIEIIEVGTKRLKLGANSESRVAFENIYVLEKP